MPNIINNLSGYDWINGTTAEYFADYGVNQQNNAEIIAYFCRVLDWTDLAISALLGNIMSESTFNPSLIEHGSQAEANKGHGLVQWTPFSDLTNLLAVIYPEGYNWENGTQQMNGLVAEYQKTNYDQHHDDAVYRNIERQWYNSTGSHYGQSYPLMDWYTWAHTDAYTVDDLTGIFMVNYLRPAYSTGTEGLPNRQARARWWYEWLTGHEPPTPPRRRKKMPLWMYLPWR